MTRMRFGYKPGVGPALKIMRNDADDPWATSNADFGKFVFNSETQSISYLLGIEKFAFGGPGVYPSVGGTSTSPNVYLPRAHYRVHAFQIGGQHYENHFFDFQAAYGLAYWPLVEMRWNKTPGTTNEMDGNVYEYRTVYSNPPSYGSAEVSSFSMRPIEIGSVVGGVLVPHLVARFTPSTNSYTAFASVWEFPGDQSAYTLPSATPSPGQKVLTLRPSRAAMARPGYDVDTATGRQFIFDGSRVPAKILAAGELTLPTSGTVDVMIPAAFQPLSPYTYVDAMTRYVGGNLNHPALPATTILGWDTQGPSFDYRVLADRVRFISNGPNDVVIRYLIGSSDDQGQSSGGGARVVRGGPGLGYVQICKPGSAEPPRLRDILVDSRLPYLPVVAEGFIPASSFSIASDDAALGTHRAADVAFTNSGTFLPFLKYTKIIRTFYSSGFVDWPYPPATVRFWNSPNQNNWHSKHSARSFVARVGSNFVRFYNSPGNPLEARWSAHPNGTPPNAPVWNENYPASGQLIGIRYYVLAIPN